jgi:hypothetical protein
MAFLKDWEPVLTNSAMQISQESVTGYKEAYNLGYQLRTRFVFLLPGLCGEKVANVGEDTQSCMLTELHSSVGQTYILVLFRLHRTS